VFGLERENYTLNKEKDTPNVASAINLISHYSIGGYRNVFLLQRESLQLQEAFRAQYKTHTLHVNRQIERGLRTSKCNAYKQYECDLILTKSRVSSGSIVSDYGLDDRAIGVRSLAMAENISSSLCVQTGSGAHPASCTMGTGGRFPGGKNAAGA
jgi:hypothetical protein